MGIMSKGLQFATKLRIMITMHSDTNNTLQEIRALGKKLTKTRKAIVEMLCSAHCLLTAPDIQENLRKKGISVNKTSVYRELEFLINRNIIQQVNISSGAVHYESALHPHHHHLVCKGCGDITGIDIQELEEHVQNVETRAQQRGFVVQNHSLEFYGVCADCK